MAEITCQGYLFKLKQNNKEWKKLYVCLKGGELIYYDGPKEASVDKRQRDGVKQIVSAAVYDAYTGFNAPTGTPSYLIIETTHAKKVYCAKSAEDRQMWVDGIKQNAEKAARNAMNKSSDAAAGKTGKGIFSSLRAPGSIFAGRRASNAASKESGHETTRETTRESRTSISSGLAFPRLSRANSQSVSLGNSSTNLVETPFIPDSELDAQLNAMADSMGLQGPQLQAVLKLPNAQKREMLKGYAMKQQSESSEQRASEPRLYAESLNDNPSFDELMECAAWLATAEIKKVAAFAEAGGADGLGGVLENLCRSGARSDSDGMKIEAAMRCLNALVKTKDGRDAVISSRKLVCRAFASSGGSLLLAEQDNLLELAVKVLGAVAVHTAEGHRVALDALDELYFNHFAAIDGPAPADDASKPFALLVERLRSERSLSVHAPILTLLNAVVNGCLDIGQRVTLRNALADLSFLELCRESLMSSDGDDIDIQIAIFDQEMRADTAELSGGSRTDLLDAIPIATSSLAGLPPYPAARPSTAGAATSQAAASSAALSGATRLAAQLNDSLANDGTKRSLEQILTVLKGCSGSLATEADFWRALGIAADAASSGASEEAIEAKVQKSIGAGTQGVAFEANYADKADAAPELERLTAELEAAQTEARKAKLAQEEAEHKASAALAKVDPAHESAHEKALKEKDEALAKLREEIDELKKPKKKVEPGAPMRPLHWAKLPDIKAPGTIWVHADLKDGIGLDDDDAGIDKDALEEIFGLGRARTTSKVEADGGGGGGGGKKKEHVQLFDIKRSNNVAIALARIRMTDEQVKEAIVDPVSCPLSAEQISALLGVLPTAEELETLKDYQGEREQLGRVEQFFLVLSDVPRLQPRLQALQAEKAFMPQWESLTEEIATVKMAAEQVRASPALKSVLLRVLALGNYLNGTSARGGAYGFKLSDLAKLVQVKSADSKTTLLHYLAKFLSSKSAGAIDELKQQLNALPEAIGIPMSEKKAELAKLNASFKLAEEQRQQSDPASDSLAQLLTDFCNDKSAKLRQLEESFKQVEQMLKDLASWLAEKPAATTEDLFAPLAEFVKTLDKAQQDNVREEEAAKRAANRPPQPSKAGGRPMPGMGGPMGMPGLGDKNMMLEMQLKMAKRAERAAGGTDGDVKQQQAALLAKQALVHQRSARKSDDAGGDGLADGLATGALFAERRAAARSGKHN